MTLLPAETLAVLPRICYDRFCFSICRCGGTGRHKGLKIPRWQHRTSSSLVSGTSGDAPRQGRALHLCGERFALCPRFLLHLFSGRTFQLQARMDALFVRALLCLLIPTPAKELGGFSIYSGEPATDSGSFDYPGRSPPIYFKNQFTFLRFICIIESIGFSIFWI